MTHPVTTTGHTQPGCLPIQQGEPYRPFKLFNGSLVPHSLAKRSDLSPWAKLLFGELASLMGRSGFCRPPLDHLADRLGTSSDTITRALEELTAAALIVSRRHGPGTSAERIFIWHPSLQESLSKDAVVCPITDPDVVRYVQKRRAETAKMRSQKATLKPPSCGFNNGTENAKMRRMKPQGRGLMKPQRCGALNKEEEVLRSRGPSEEDHDRDFSSLDSLKRNTAVAEVSQCLEEFISSSVDKTLTGRMPAEAIANRLYEIGGGLGDLGEFLKIYQERWVEEPRTWRHVRESALKHFADPEVVDAIADRKKSAAIQEQLRLEAERRQQTEAVRARALDEKQRPADAIKEARKCYGQIPDILVRRLIRLDRLISPREVIDEAKSCREHCKNCRNTGQRGSALKGTLQFCSCMWGEESRAEHGEDFIGVQIAKAKNGSLQERLKAQCDDDPNIHILSHVIAQCEFQEGDEIHVKVPRHLKLWLEDKAYERRSNN